MTNTDSLEQRVAELEKQLERQSRVSQAIKDLLSKVVEVMLDRWPDVAQDNRLLSVKKALETVNPVHKPRRQQST